MILRRVIKHMKNQEWTAIALDFLIVVIGVFVGLQVNNWNEARTLKDRETELLTALRTDIQLTLDATQAKILSFEQVGEAGARALAFLENGQSCEDACWPVVVDFFHASQWQKLRLNRSTYDDMRRLGLPRSRELINAVESYYTQNESLAFTLDEAPDYRAIVRGLIPLAIHDAYWVGCFKVEVDIESYLLDCPQAVSNEVAAQTAAAITAEPRIKPTLTDWTGYVRSYPSAMNDEIGFGEKAIAVLDAEMERRK